jgi:hypothetical protein
VHPDDLTRDLGDDQGGAGPRARAVIGHGEPRLGHRGERVAAPRIVLLFT